MEREEFEQELTWLLNKYNLGRHSNIPEFILAAYLNECLKAFNRAYQTKKTFLEGLVKRENA